MILAQDLVFGYKETETFKKVSFFVNRGEKVGLVGQNGSGKTTLFRLICGILSPDFGRLEVEVPATYVPQEIKRDPQMDAAKSTADYLDPTNSFPLHEIRIITDKLGLTPEVLSQSPKSLSGGQKTRLALARALLTQPPLLLLDEPTNFMDPAGRAWVMKFLSQYTGTLIVVSHDLELMSGALDKILYINQQTKEIDEYSGNYQSFVKLKKEKEDLLIRKITTEQKHIADMKKGLLKMSAHSEKGVRRKLQQIKRIEQMEANLPDFPAVAKSFKLHLPDPIHVGQVPIFATGIYKSFGDKQVLKDVNLTLMRGEKTALIGPNGTGKTTLIKILLKELEPDAGQVVQDTQLQVGYYNQELDDLDYELNLYQTLFNLDAGLKESQIRSILGRMLFVGDKIYQSVASLSGGEKTRLSIAKLLGVPSNLLILDEPTTYLDPLSQRLILESLKSYQGTMLIVSHSQQFLDELDVDKKYHVAESRLQHCHIR